MLCSNFLHTLTSHPRNERTTLPEPGRAATHDLALAHELCVKLGAVEREVDVEVDAVKSALRGVHAFEVLFEIFAREV